jgi:hypothetical protein
MVGTATWSWINHAVRTAIPVDVVVIVTLLARTDDIVATQRVTAVGTAGVAVDSVAIVALLDGSHDAVAALVLATSAAAVITDACIVITLLEGIPCTIAAEVRSRSLERACAGAIVTVGDVAIVTYFASRAIDDAVPARTEGAVGITGSSLPCSTGVTLLMGRLDGPISAGGVLEAAIITTVTIVGIPVIALFEAIADIVSTAQGGIAALASLCLASAVIAPIADNATRITRIALFTVHYIENSIVAGREGAVVVTVGRVHATIVTLLAGLDYAVTTDGQSAVIVTGQSSGNIGFALLAIRGVPEVVTAHADCAVRVACSRVAVVVARLEVTRGRSCCVLGHGVVKGITAERSRAIRIARGRVHGTFLARLFSSRVDMRVATLLPGMRKRGKTVKSGHGVPWG